MKRTGYLYIMLWALCLGPYAAYGQEEELKTEESAEVFLEEYSDQFQENFFEALKQKGIENYDKAINLLLECKRLDPVSAAVDHELAKAYFGDKKWIPAQEHAIGALLSEPGNIWYLNTLIGILHKQGGSLEGISSKIPMDHVKLRENLALVYFELGHYEEALRYLKDLKDSGFKNELSLKIRDSIQKRNTEVPTVVQESPVKELNDPAEAYIDRLNDLIGNNSVPLIGPLTDEALERYPAHPFFYYARGFVLNREARYREAVEALETALDYLLDDIPLANLIYKELAGAHNALGDSSKANMYLRKINSP